MATATVYVKSVDSWTLYSKKSQGDEGLGSGSGNFQLNERCLFN